MAARKDQLFLDTSRPSGEFDFGTDTARVFDDMLQRSVPFYAEIQRMITELAGDFASSGTRVYDLGCSTGATLLSLAGRLPAGVRLIGIDASPAMLDEARDKLAQATRRPPCELQCQDINQGAPIEQASVVIMNLTLQFIRPLNRQRLIRDIAAGLQDGGCLILVEKVLSQNSLINRLFMEHHYAFKGRNGYDEIEITRKREALENVLIPYHDRENETLLLENGFKSCDSFFRWYNFCGMLAVK